ncbi:hypothetical protein SARC_02095 [Sphaeroforma arctica JP610]|uniref:Uncharacterized protein n=1 Tax=Sphaeroforma arctica JP610 TaxID=667725 RepID=A0A0L0GA15_9EUKA|nr:hypothetical protein SARC_02095 [Sphaeroforma arctica JP610]KNC85721.1 hypothetical protein SARC_02095 [Sphaeroforma arctica JP610]|eukprot:XP_014159623.1 hypothetical protein SARC_02095 [Sphaeroforma arctica JP610]
MAGRAVVKVIHFYDIYDMATNDPTTMQIFYKLDRGKTEKNTLVRSFDIPLILRAIREGIRDSLYGFDDVLIIRVVQRDAVLLPLGKFKPQKCGHYIETYEAHCDWLGLKPHPNVHRYIDGIYRLGLTEVTLDEMPGVLDAASPDCVPLEPILLALRYNTFFEGVVALEASMMDRNLASIMAQVVTTNTRLEKIEMRNSGCSWATFFNGLKTNTQHMVNDLCLAGSKLGAHSVAGLCEAIKVWPYGIKALDFAASGIDDKKMLSFCHAMRCNLGASATIKQLTLSDNILGDLGSSALQQWMSAANTSAALQVLEMENTDINMHTIAQGLWDLGCLKNFDARGCSRKMTEDRLYTLKETLTKSNTISVLGLSSDGTKSTADGSGKEDNIMPLIRAFLRNPRITEATLRLTGVADGRQLVSTLQGVDTHLLKHIDLSGCQFSEVDLAVLLNDVASTCKNLVTLVLDGCCKETSGSGGGTSGYTASTKKGADAPLAISLEILMGNCPNLRRLSLRGGFCKALIGCMRALGECKTITHLDIRDNAVGDALAYDLAVALDKNRTLTHLWCSENDFTVNGWASVLSSLTHQAVSPVLQYIHRPVEDEKVHVGKGNVAFRQYTNLIDKIQRAVAAQGGNTKGPLTDVWEPKPPSVHHLSFEPRLSLPQSLKDAQEFAIANGEAVEWVTGGQALTQFGKPKSSMESTGAKSGGPNSPAFSDARFQTFDLHGCDGGE